MSQIRTCLPKIHGTPVGFPGSVQYWKMITTIGLLSAIGRQFTGRKHIERTLVP